MWKKQLILAEKPAIFESGSLTIRKTCVSRIVVQKKYFFHFPGFSS